MSFAHLNAERRTADQEERDAARARQIARLPEWAGKSPVIYRRAIDVLTECTLSQEGAFHRYVSLCESPIEALALAAMFRVFPGSVVAETKEELKSKEDWTFGVIPQMPFKGYRLDFGVMNRMKKTAFALECDGRESHKDKHHEDCKRAIHLWNAGIQVFRVSGSALCRDPLGTMEPFGRLVRGLP